MPEEPPRQLVRPLVRSVEQLDASGLGVARARAFVVANDAPVLLVHAPVTVRAQQATVAHRGLATVRPVNQVVHLQEARGIAARELAAAVIARRDRPDHGGGPRTLLPTDRQGFTAGGSNGDDVRVTSDSTRSSANNVSSACCRQASNRAARSAVSTRR